MSETRKVNWKVIAVCECQTMEAGVEGVVTRGTFWIHFKGSAAGLG